MENFFVCCWFGGGVGHMQKKDQMLVLFSLAWIAAAVAWLQTCVALDCTHEAMLQRGCVSMELTVWSWWIVAWMSGCWAALWKICCSVVQSWEMSCGRALSCNAWLHLFSLWGHIASIAVWLWCRIRYGWYPVVWLVGLTMVIDNQGKECTTKEDIKSACLQENKETSNQAATLHYSKNWFTHWWTSWQCPRHTQTALKLSWFSHYSTQSELSNHLNVIKQLWLPAVICLNNTKNMLWSYFHAFFASLALLWLGFLGLIQVMFGTIQMLWHYYICTAFGDSMSFFCHFIWLANSRS